MLSVDAVFLLCFYMTSTKDPSKALRGTMYDQRILSDLLMRMRQTLEKGEIIAIVGWKASNHNEFTKGLPKEKMVFKESSQDPPLGASLVLMTRFVDHTFFEHLKKGWLVHPVPLDTGKIKKLLEGCKDLLEVAKPLPQARIRAPTVEEGELSQFDRYHEIMDFLTEPRKEMNEMEKFTTAFFKEAERNHGRVSTFAIGKLIREHKAPQPPSLIKDGWIVPEVSSGKKKIGWYRAGDKMQGLKENLEHLPEDPLERAKALIAKKPKIAAQKTELEKQIEELDGKLSLIEQAENLMRQLTNLLKSQE